MSSLLSRLHQRGIPLYLYLTTFAIIISAVLSSLIIYSTYVERKQLEQDSIQKQFQSISEKIQQGLDDRVEPLTRLVEANASFSIGPQDLGKNPSLRTDFLDNYSRLFTYYPKFFSTNLGFKSGHFIYLINLDSGIELRNFIPPPRAKFLLGYNLLDSQKTNQTIAEFYDQDLNLISTQTIESDYNLNMRPWYTETIKADTIIITPYRFSATSQRGLAIGIPLTNGKGVYSISSNIDTFMDSMSSSFNKKQSSVYLLDVNTHKILAKHLEPTHVKIFNASNCEVITYDGQILHNKKEHLEGACDIDTIFNKIITSYYSANTSTRTHQFSSHGEKFHFELVTVKFRNQDVDLFMVTSSANTLENISSSFNNILLFTIIAICITIPISYAVARLISKPLSHIAAEALNIRNNDFKPSQPINTSVMELKSLISSIGSMKESLLEYIQRLHSGQDTLQKKVEEKTQELNDALILANDATQAKGQFLSTMSHELRTPMNAILGFTYIFDRSNLNDEQKNQLEKIRLSSESLLYIINDILDFSKLEAGKLSIESIPFSLDELLHSTIDMIQQLAEAKNLELILERDKDLPNFLIGDPNRLRQVLINLIGNAIKFTGKGYVKICVQRTVRLQLSKKDMPKTPNSHISIAFNIKDTGIGMTEEQMSKLFQSFSQVDASVSRKFGGSGLGLHISKQLITLMDGDISVQSEKGKGSEFSAHLTFDIANANVFEGKLPTKEKKYKEGALALVVDDNQINLEVSKALLNKFKVNVETVMSGQDAINSVKTTAYDIIFMDIQMPEMDGLTACTHIRAMAHDSEAPYATNVKDVPIIAMTANAMEEDRLKCLEVGMNEHIAKPITPSILLFVIQEWLAVDDDDIDNNMLG